MLSFQVPMLNLVLGIFGSSQTEPPPLCTSRWFCNFEEKIRRAVDRSRFRRVFREYLRTQFIAPTSDIVVIARQVPHTLRSSQFKEELHHALTKLSKRLRTTDAS